MNVLNQQERHAKWKALIEQQETSHLSQKAFCQQQGISFAQLSYYRRVLKQSALTTPTSTDLFSPIHITSSESLKTQHEVKIVLPNGFHCHLSASLDSVKIQKIVEVLLSC